jgi:hypothetical protein
LCAGRRAGDGRSKEVFKVTLRPGRVRWSLPLSCNVSLPCPILDRYAENYKNHVTNFPLSPLVPKTSQNRSVLAIYQPKNHPFPFLPGVFLPDFSRPARRRKSGLDPRSNKESGKVAKRSPVRDRTLWLWEVAVATIGVKQKGSEITHVTGEVRPSPIGTDRGPGEGVVSESG